MYVYNEVDICSAAYAKHFFMISLIIATYKHIESMMSSLCDLRVCVCVCVQSSLQSLVTERETMMTSLSDPVDGLDQLAIVLQLLHTVTDMQSTVDQLYLPVEQLYSLLRYKLVLYIEPYLKHDCMCAIYRTAEQL